MCHGAVGHYAVPWYQLLCQTVANGGRYRRLQRRLLRHFRSRDLRRRRVDTVSKPSVNTSGRAIRSSDPDQDLQIAMHPNHTDLKSFDLPSESKPRFTANPDPDFIIE